MATQRYMENAPGITGRNPNSESTGLSITCDILYLCTWRRELKYHITVVLLRPPALEVLGCVERVVDFRVHHDDLQQTRFVNSRALNQVLMQRRLPAASTSRCRNCRATGSPRRIPRRLVR
jgi:hypothetical protein